MSKLKVYFIFTILALFITNFCWAMSTDNIIVKTSKNEINKQAYSTIKINYPVIKNVPNSEKANTEINRIIDDIVKDFKKNLSENQPIHPISDLPLTVDSNALDISYKVFKITPNMVSIRFSIYTFFYGAAHPFTTFKSLNYDFSKGKVLSLDDIFQSNEYLQFLATYSKNALTKQLSKAASSHTEPESEGIKPIAENFAIWNLIADGLLLTFPPYQVAAYVFGPQEVLIPYAVMKKMLQVDNT